MSWTSTYWKQTDNNYPIPVSVDIPTPVDKSKIYTVWNMSSSVLSGYPYPTLPTAEIDRSKIYAIWKMNANIADGYPIPIDYEPQVLGAFAYCENLESIDIPMSVSHIGRHAFYKTSLTSIKIAPDCKYFSTSFPNVSIYYYNASISSIVLPTDPLIFTVGDNWVSVLSSVIVNLQLSDSSTGKSITRPTTNYVISGVATDSVVTDATGTITVYRNDGTTVVDSTTFTYSVVSA